jgi:hypothetical protein
VYHVRLLEESSKRQEAKSREYWLKDLHFASKEEKSRWPSNELLGVSNVSIRGVCPSGQEDPMDAPHARARVSIAPKKSEGSGGLGRDASEISVAGPVRPFRNTA